MREPRVHTANDLTTGSEITLEPGPARHLLKVLRLGPNAPLKLFNGDGGEFAARLIHADKDRVTAKIEAKLAFEPPPSLPLLLLIGISKGERMDFAIQKAVELGVSRIQPLFCGRSVVQLKGERLQRRLDHWRGIIIGACEQSGRCRLPDLHPPTKLNTALDQSLGYDCRLVLHHKGAKALKELDAPKKAVALLIGPEGGLTPAELQLAQNAGFIPLRLGPRVLRTETAPLAALAAIQTLWGDF